MGNLASGVWGGISGSNRKPNAKDAEAVEDKAADEAESSAGKDDFF